MNDPVADRPDAPQDYGYATGPEGMLGWDLVSETLAKATVYFISTVRPDGGPHTSTIWGGFVNNRLYVEGGPTTRWARNLAHDPRVGFGVDGAGLHITGRGSAHHGKAGADFEALRAGYAAKYAAFGYEPESDQFWRVEPSIIIAIDANSMASFTASPTRFTFDEGP